MKEGINRVRIHNHKLAVVANELDCDISARIYDAMSFCRKTGHSQTQALTSRFWLERNLSKQAELIAKEVALRNDVYRNASH